MTYDIEVADMMEAGAHFGHQTKRWNPKMRPFLYGARSGVHIIDLQKTKDLAIEALKFIEEAVASGKDMLFVGTKMQARVVIKDQAIRAGMFYVTDRWMGGTLTNFKTIKKSIDRLIDLETRREKNDFEGYTKKELLDIDRTITKLEASLGGIKKMKGAPGLLFVVDPKLEKIAILEAQKLGIPVIAMTDSNCDPEPIDYIIPSNDDAISSIQYFTVKVADSCLAGVVKRQEDSQKKAMEFGKSKGGKPKRKRRTAKGTEVTKTYVARGAREDKFEGKDAEGFSAKVEKAENPKSDEEKPEDPKKPMQNKSA